MRRHGNKSDCIVVPYLCCPSLAFAHAAKQNGALCNNVKPKPILDSNFSAPAQGTILFVPAPATEDRTGPCWFWFWKACVCVCGRPAPGARPAHCYFITSRIKLIWAGLPLFCVEATGAL